MFAKYKIIMKLLFLIYLSILISGCGNKSTLYFYSLDRSQCITVISVNDERYIINGKHTIIPDTNYVKLLIKNRNSIWDNFYICWKNKAFEWDSILENSVILESKLDTSRFNFNTELPKDKRGIPTEIKFEKENCAIYSFYLKKLSPNRGAVVVYK